MQVVYSSLLLNIIKQSGMQTESIACKCLLQEQDNIKWEGQSKSCVGTTVNKKIKESLTIRAKANNLHLQSEHPLMRTETHLSSQSSSVVSLCLFL